MIEKAISRWGLLGDLDSIREKIRRNITIASSNLHHLIGLAKAGELHKLPQDQALRLLQEASDALDQVAT